MKRASRAQLSKKSLPLNCSEQRQNIDAVLDVIATVAKAKDNVWVYRKAFDAYKQQTDQTFKQFYAEIVKLASMCEFGKDFCEDDKIRAIDQCLLMKLVLHTSDSIVQRKLMEVPDLDYKPPCEY